MIRRIAAFTALLAAACLLPGLAHAHTLGEHFATWRDGFLHPLHGWDHFATMVAIGLWAAQQKGRALWLLPLTFVGAMALGIAAGAAGLHCAGTEAVLGASLLVLAGLILRRIRPGLALALPLVAALAFLHGLAHGENLPAPGEMLTFGVGVLAATLLLHGAGIAAVRLGMMLATAFWGGSAGAQQFALADAPSGLPEILVTGRQDSLLGIAASASQGSVGREQFDLRPMLRTGELLETVPGVIITQHAGGGKANQYFLRGFNLDHGTDFATSIDGMPVNLPTHGHGQGYSDLNFVIPELVERIDYAKGIYDAANGDFSSAGAAKLHTYTVLPRYLAQVEGGMHGHGRGVFAASPRVGAGTLLAAAELAHEDGPWRRPDNFRKANGLLAYSQGDAGSSFRIAGRYYRGRWNSSDQVAASAVEDGLVPLFGSLDDTTQGISHRASLQAGWHRKGAQSETSVDAYGFRYDLDLFSNFTYFLVDPVRGDQFEQVDRRLAGGLNARHAVSWDWSGRAMENSFGLQLRHDRIRNGLFNTEALRRVDKQDEDGNRHPATARRDRVRQTSLGLTFQNRIQWAEKVRTDVGVREDIYRFSVASNQAANSGRRTASMPSPKASLTLGPWAGTEFYLQGGLGFHSNDGRGALTHVDPLSGRAQDGDGNPIRPADPLVRTKGAEIGVRTLAVEGLQSTLSLWWLDIDSELLFVGDAGTTEPSRPSRRMGIEFANYYSVTDFLSLDADLALSRTRFRDAAPEGRRIPGSIETVVSGGVTVHHLAGSLSGLSGSLRLRYFGPRPLVEDDSIRSKQTLLLNARVAYRFDATWSLSADILNLLDRRDHDIDYAYESRVTPAADPVTQIHFHPVEPRQIRVALTARF